MEGIASNAEQRGVIYNCFEHIFNHIANSRNQQYLVRASYLEIYQVLIILIHLPQNPTLIIAL